MKHFYKNEMNLKKKMRTGETTTTEKQKIFFFLNIPIHGQRVDHWSFWNRTEAYRNGIDWVSCVLK